MNLQNFIGYLLSHKNVRGSLFTKRFGQDTYLFRTLAKDLPNDKLIAHYTQNEQVLLVFDGGNQFECISYNSERLCGMRTNFILIPSVKSFTQDEIEKVLIPYLVVPYNFQSGQATLPTPRFKPFLYAIEEDMFLYGKTI